MVLKEFNWSRPAPRIGLHVLFWAVIVFYFAWGFGFTTRGPKVAFINALLFLPGHMIMAYTLLYFLVPKYLLQNKLWHFFFGFVGLVLVCATYASLTQISISAQARYAGVSISGGRNVLPFIHVGGIAASVKLLKYWYLQRKRTREAEQQRTIAELKLLKAQLHPHFLFNTLNNLYSHTLEFSPKSPEIVLKLSALLRFMIYESNASNIPLSKEIELLKDYISLEQLRYGDRLEMSITVTGDIERYQIAPLLLLPFLENAFKHGTSKQIDQCWISFNLCVENGLMTFKLLNSIDPTVGADNLKHAGIGLGNVKQRLELLYKDKYQFETVRMEEVFVVNLVLPLDELKVQEEPKPELSNAINYAIK
ncbi:histidine kinase [Chryseolinea sp. T2]|uniref:sensor histidine kinase n=1 Tax=Chryseolinea sp. T2 TaxID=3129255 RepID=UPI003078954A